MPAVHDVHLILIFEDELEQTDSLVEELIS